MKVETIEKLVTENTKDGTVDFEAINKAINAETDALIEKKLGSAKEGLAGDAVNDFIKSQGYDNVDQFTAFVKNSKAGANELTEKVARLESENGKLNDQIKEATEAAQKSHRANVLSGLNIKEEMRGYSEYEINKLVSDDVSFEDAAKTFIKANGHVLADGQPGKKTAPRHRQPGPGHEGMDGVEAALMERHPDLK